MTGGRGRSGPSYSRRGDCLTGDRAPGAAIEDRRFDESAHDNKHAERDRLWKMIKDIKFAMFTTRHGNGHLHARR